MVNVRVDSGELPSMNDCDDKHQMSRVLGRWMSIAHGRFRNDCRFLLQMIDETDNLELWKVGINGFTYESRDEFLQKQVLIDYDLTASDFTAIAEKLRLGEKVCLTYREQVAPRNAEIKERAAAGETQQSIADAVGLSREGVAKVLVQKPANTKKTTKAKRINSRQIYLGTDPKTAADKIREKFGDKYADNLAMAIKYGDNNGNNTKTKIQNSTGQG